MLILAVLISDLLLEKVFVIKTAGGQVLSQGYFICVITIVFLALHFFCYFELQKEKNIFQRSFVSYIGKISFALLVLFIIGSMTVFVSLPVFQVISDFRLISYLFIFIGLALLYFTLFGFVRAFITDRHSSEIMTIKITTIGGLILSVIVLLF
ncbi:hypothetical protein D7Z54_24975 [Salibacterium salarium]|uniref:Uncharacterized protein n=1 Tax=Salibacterium salarium TaxID=284579 RepID=A0A428MWT5_9BACI|nr:hypothetical protein D7Z54_24975 [Salibacterium salarium]